MANTDNGYYKLSWGERIGFNSGELAQNLIYQTISIWLLFYYNNVFGLDAGTVAVMFLVVRIIDVLWDPMVGAFVDKSHLPWGKYRSWLLIGGLPLAAFAMLCFWNGFSGSLLYAYVTYVGMSMCFTLINVPYGALSASLTRDTNEITILTSVRMLMANTAGLIIKTLPLVVVLFAPKVLNEQTGEMEAVYNTPEAGGAWFITMSIFALTGLVLTWVGFKAGASAQTPLAEQGILWLVTLIPAALFVLAIYVIGKYELSDEKMDEINAAITGKLKN